MKILVAYYSRSGSTELLAKEITSELLKRGHLVEVEKITPVNDYGFLKWFLVRIFKDDCPILEPKIKDVSDYDLVCFGGPNWTRAPLPLARYVKTLSGLPYKKIAFFSTTALPPSLEWYIFSAYFLEQSFNSLARKRNARVGAFVLLSGIFKNWKTGSSYAQKAIEAFCRSLELPLSSNKECFLNQRGAEESRFLLIFFLSLIPVSLFVWFKFFFFSNYLYFFAGHFLFCYFLALTSRYQKLLAISKYLTILVFSLFWTAVVYNNKQLLPFLLFGYLAIIIFSSLFKEPASVFFAGLLSLAALVFFNYPAIDQGVVIQLVFVLSCVFLEAIIALSSKKYFLKMLEIQDEIESAKNLLEEKVKLRTKELADSARRLDEEVKERTKELQEKVVTLERFNKLAIGRELKMVSLKEELDKLKKESRNS